MDLILAFKFEKLLIFILRNIGTGAVALRCRKRFLYLEAVRGYRKWVKKRLKEQNNFQAI